MNNPTTLEEAIQIISDLNKEIDRLRFEKLECIEETKVDAKTIVELDDFLKKIERNKT